MIDDLKNLLTEVVTLTANVRTLQERDAQRTAQIEKLTSDVNDLKTELAVTKVQLEASAKDAAVNTVLETYAQTIERIISLETKVHKSQSPRVSFQGNTPKLENSADGDTR